MSSARCSEISRAAGESLAATATTAERWLLVEVRGGWPRDVGKSEALPDAARDAVSAWLAGTPRSRLLFVRRPARGSGPSLAFVVDAPESGGSVRRFELETLDELVDADLVGGGDPVEARLVLVCAHGSRDTCCALRGTAVFGALAPGIGEEELWISSHQGGHRFAANVIVLPDAVQLGRLDPEEAPGVVSDALEGTIRLDRYRGRTCHDPVVQAAEHAVRSSAGLDRVGDLRLLDVSGSTARFAALDGVEFAVEVAGAEGLTLPVSCGADPEPQPALSARLL